MWIPTFCLLMSALILPAVTGCERDRPGCDLLFLRMDRCVARPLDRQEFVKQCQNSADGRSREIRCSKIKNCQAFVACLETARVADDLGRAEREIVEAESRNDHATAWRVCEMHEESQDQNLQKRCAALLPNAFAGLVREAEHRRAEKPHPDPPFCFRLTDLGTRIGEMEKAQAQRLCAEIELGVILERARTDVENIIKLEKNTLSKYCMEDMLEPFDAVDSAFSRMKKQELLQLCFVQLGGVLLQKFGPTIKNHCPLPARTVVRNLRRHGMRNASVDRLVEQASPWCDWPETEIPTSASGQEEERP